MITKMNESYLATKEATRIIKQTQAYANFMIRSIRLFAFTSGMKKLSNLSTIFNKSIQYIISYKLKSC